MPADNPFKHPRPPRAAVRWNKLVLVFKDDVLHGFDGQSNHTGPRWPIRLPVVDERDLIGCNCDETTLRLGPHMITMTQRRDFLQKTAGGFAIAATCPLTALASNPSFDLVIRGGTLVDGTGTPGVRHDLGIKGARIAAIGNLSEATARRVINATNRIVCPGFIDMHTHSDSTLLQDGLAKSAVRQGATTHVVGNCGSSPTDIATFFRDLRNGGTGPNIAILVGHGSVRQKVMGRRPVPPTADQLQQMKDLVRQAMRDGAVGLSTSLRYGPGSYAGTEEIVALATEIKPFGGFYATHMRDEGTRIVEALEEALVIGRRAEIPVHVSHHKISSASVFGLTRQTLARIDAARRNGVDVSLDQYPYGAGSGGVALYVPQRSLAGLSLIHI